MISSVYKTCFISILGVSSILFGAGCKNGTMPAPKPTPKEYHIQGLWAGTASNATITIPYYLTLKPDGTCSFEGITAGEQENFGFGTWSLSGTALTANITTVYGVPANIGVKQTVSGVFDSTTGILKSLTWTDVAGATDNGTFSLEKASDDVDGVWVGTASNATITIPYSLSLKQDGTCYFEGITAGNEENFGFGTWTLSGTALTANITTVYGVTTNLGVKQTVSGAFDSKAGTLTSLTWTDILGATDHGIFSLTKSN